MKLRLGIGIGLLGLLIVGMVAWGSSTQRSISGTIVAVGKRDLPLFAPDAADTGALLLCTPAGDWPARSRELNGAVFIHVPPFARVLDGRGWLLSSTSRFEQLAVGQQIEVWTTDETLESWPPQVYAVKIEIGDAPKPGQAAGDCHWNDGLSP
jgi:hypothetical protein